MSINPSATFAEEWLPERSIYTKPKYKRRSGFTVFEMNDNLEAFGPNGQDASFAL